MAVISLLITDLDNTLYDWVSSFVPAFYAMVERAARILDIDEERLLDELRDVHQRHGSSEHPFALMETPSAGTLLSHLDHDGREAALDDAFHAFNSIRKRNLKLYDGVAETLREIRRRNVPIVGHTDAKVANSLFRIEKLGLDGLIDSLYAPAHLHGTRARKQPAHIPLEGFVRTLPPEDRKPNPKTLCDICADYGISPQETLYVGDSLSRDVFMAQLAGAHSAWAKYGTVFDSAYWPKLVRITHWTEADVERERQLNAEARAAVPNRVLGSFADLLRLFRFEGKASGLAGAA